jgi:hypothetical protein
MALAAHYTSSPWCLSTFTKTYEPTASAKHYWNHYNAIPRKIAYENGKPVAFSSSDSATSAESTLIINGKSYPLISVNSNYGVSLPNDVRREDNLVNSGLFETFEQDGKKWLSLGYYNQQHPNVALLNNKGVEEAKKSGSIKETQEAWWDMEDLKPQDKLSDDIVSDPKLKVPIFDNDPDAFNQPGNWNPWGGEDIDLPFFMTPQGEVYGFVDEDGNIYLDENVIDEEHPIHEYTHLWDRVVSKVNPELWNAGVQLMKQTNLWDQIKND